MLQQYISPNINVNKTILMQDLMGGQRLRYTKKKKALPLDIISARDLASTSIEESYEKVRSSIDTSQFDVIDKP